MGRKLKTRKGLHAEHRRRRDRRCHILRMPFEVQQMICEAVLAAPAPINRHSLTWDNLDEHNLLHLMRLSQTCRALYQAATPVLYRQIDLTWISELKRAETYVFKFFCLLRTIVTNKPLAELVRYADLESLIFNSVVWELPDKDPEAWAVLEEIGVTRKQPADDSVSSDPPPPITNTVSFLMAILLSSCPNLRYARLPYPPEAVEILESFGRSAAFTINSWSRPSIVVEWNPKRSPNTPLTFPNLEELDTALRFGYDDEEGNEDRYPLGPKCFTYILDHAPKLRTLRLQWLWGISYKGPSWNLGNITSLTLDTCDGSYLAVHQLVKACRSLRKFKISNSRTDWEGYEPKFWDGQEGFEDNVPLEADGKDFDHDHKDWDNTTGQPYLPWSSCMVSSSLILSALLPASDTLETILLGDCRSYRVRGGINWNRRKLCLAKFTSLKTLGISSCNLFSANCEKGDSDSALPDMVEGCASLKNLMIFNPTPGKNNKYYWPPLENAVRALAERLSSSNNPGPLPRQLEKVSICSRFHDWDRPRQSDSRGHLAHWRRRCNIPETEDDDPEDDGGIGTRTGGDDPGVLEPPGKRLDLGDPLLWGKEPPELPEDITEAFIRNGIQVVNLSGWGYRSRTADWMNWLYPVPKKVEDILLW